MSPRTTISRSLAKYSGTIGMFSRWMYSQTSSSVQFESGNTRMLSPLVQPGIEEVPQFRPLVLRIPLAVRIAERVDAFLGARFLFVAAGSADRRIELAFRQSIEQSAGFQQTAALLGAQVAGIGARFDRCPVRVDDQLRADFRGRTGRGIRSSRGICKWYRCAAAGTESGPGWNAFCARRTITDESLPMEYSMTGRSKLGHTSRRI